MILRTKVLNIYVVVKMFLLKFSNQFNFFSFASDSLSYSETKKNWFEKFLKPKKIWITTYRDEKYLMFINSQGYRKGGGGLQIWLEAPSSLYSCMVYFKQDKKMSNMEKSYPIYSVIVPANHVVTIECFVNEASDSSVCYIYQTWTLAMSERF